MKKYFLILMALSFLNYVGCYSSDVISKKDLDEGNAQIDFNYELTVQTIDYTQYHFDARNYQIKGDTLYGSGKIEKNGLLSPFNGKIAMDEIQSFKQPEMDAGTTAGLGLGVIAIGVLAVGLFLLAAVTDAFNRD